MADPVINTNETPAAGTQTETPVSDFNSKIVLGILNSITLTPDGAEKTDSFDPDAEPDGPGVVTCEVTKLEQLNPGVPDFFASVSVLGQTFASTDPNKAIIRTLFADVMRSVMSMTAASLTTTTGLTVDGILPISNAAIREGADRFMFTVDFKIAVGNLSF